MAKDISNAYLVTTARRRRHGQHRLHGQRAAQRRICSRRIAPVRCATSSSRRRMPIITAACRRCAKPRRKVIAERRFVERGATSTISALISDAAPASCGRHDEARRESAAAAGSRARHRRRPPLRIRAGRPHVRSDLHSGRRSARFGRRVDAEGTRRVHRQSVRPGVPRDAESSSRRAATSRAWCSATCLRSTRCASSAPSSLITGHGDPIRGADKIRADRSTRCTPPFRTSNERRSRA